MSLPPPDNSLPNTGDQAWLLTSAALVQIMTPGLAFFYGGLVNEGSVVNTLMLSYSCMGIVTLLWGLVGYSLCFDASTDTGVIGVVDLAASKFGYQLRSSGPASYFSISESAYMIFQLMFAIISCAIISGAVVQKMRYSWFVAFTAMWLIFVYCPLAHWFFSWTGFLFSYGVLDFAGGLVVHTSSGVSAFVLTFWLGRSKVKNVPHNVPYVLLGTALLWCGWFGFNAGSALSANYVAAEAFVNTQYAAAVGMLTWNLLEIIFSGPKWFRGAPSAVGAACGVVTGLVAITPAAGFVSNMWAFFFGFFGVIPTFFTPRVVRLLGVDDRLDCFAFHGIGGITGTLLTGLFANVDDGSPVNGAFYWNAPQYAKQIAGIMVTVLLSTVATTVIYWVLWAAAKACGTTLTIPAEDQHAPDLSQHGEAAYYKTAAAVAAKEEAAAEKFLADPPAAGTEAAKVAAAETKAAAAAAAAATTATAV